MSAPAAQKFASYWRRAGLNYLEMLNTANGALVQVLKEPARSAALKRGAYAFNSEAWVAGNPEKVVHFDSASVAKK
eukprot:CAMPEP_0203815428 /NCGR_PEP_ID=MMETSP0115-20131106/11114_1 /ASSEMBLY_ACC=CAM_ASM_000227 /TAXON_ID=33651 /ORGANISM="Bicosoecid sp, Strain ms1" /LENGTH=75 /DNA_ID=CAMNT_0050724325 /DNA_START=23 /DNA_END=250 /DNA_ORIENTATION=-